MAAIKIRTKGNSSYHGRRRIYFCCHPDDFDKYFDEICSDIFSVMTVDCAIYYTEDMTEPLSDVDYLVNFKYINLLVVPVTWNLLIDDNRAMRSDIERAQAYNIPILPFMMEEWLDEIYSFPVNFGRIQYIKPNSTDESEMKYDEKLRKYLESVILSNETVRNIRAAFTTYIFLSYRKRDRALANDLMKAIHTIPECRNVAIWYDEFLSVSENFDEDIEEAMDKCGVFVLLVTPALLEEGNYIMTVEYPKAIEKGMNILPVEVEQTDYEELCKAYPGIPACINPYNSTELHDAIMKYLPGLKFSARRPKTAEHNYLMGLAYLNGVDVEINVELAVEFLELAADDELYKAMYMLYNMFSDGKIVNVDYEIAVKWAERIVAYCTREYGERRDETLVALNNLGNAYVKLGEYEKALNIHKLVYDIRLDLYGEEHSHTLTSLSNLAYIYGKLGDYTKASELNEKAYALRKKVLGEKNPDTLTSLSNLASTYSDIGDYTKELELVEKAYTLRKEVLGEEHPDTLTSLSNLASTYRELGDHTKALELGEKVYTLRKKVLSEEHPDTLTSLSHLALTYSKLGDYTKELELGEKAYALRKKVLGEKNPDTLTSLSNLASTYSDIGDYTKALELGEKAYTLYKKVLGEEHPYTLTSLSNLVITYITVGNYTKVLELGEKALELYEKAKELLEKLLGAREKSYTLRKEMLGEEHPDTLTSLSDLASTYSKLGDHTKALELKGKACALRKKVLGEEHPDTVKTKKEIDAIRQNIAQ